MEELIKNIREMGIEWFIASLEEWNQNTEMENVNEVIEDLNYHLGEERSCAPN